jgi:hypothetical protein
MRFDATGPVIWHFNPDCPEYPTSEYVERTGMPSDKTLCRRCADPAAERFPSHAPAVKHLM